MIDPHQRRIHCQLLAEDLHDELYACGDLTALQIHVAALALARLLRRHPQRRRRILESEQQRRRNRRKLFALAVQRNARQQLTEDCHPDNVAACYGGAPVSE